MKIGQITFNDIPVILAPMEDITDAPFRILCKRFGADLMFTEFISSEGLIRFAGKSVQKLAFHESERPIGIQVFGHDPASMRRAVEIAEGAKPDIIDINYGCPVKKVVNKGAGAAILRDIPRMVELTSAVVRATNIPVTVKTRLGWDSQSINIPEVAERLQDLGIQALTIHARTRSQLYGGKADWSWIGKVKNNPRMKIPVIGNGDIDSPLKAKEMIDNYGVDGIMIGRASIGNPFIFKEITHYLRQGQLLPHPSLETRIDIFLEHLSMSAEAKGEKQSIIESRKLLSGYFKGLYNFKPYKLRLLQIDNLDDLRKILSEIKEQYITAQPGVNDSQ
jgi:tRNA-dihydrouridine synthase B